MAWLLRQGEVLASLELARSPSSRIQGLAGRDHTDAALLLSPCRVAHTIAARFAIDVAYLNEELVVLDTVRMSPYRIGRPRRGAQAILEVESGAFERWKLMAGDHLEITE